MQKEMRTNNAVWPKIIYDNFYNCVAQVGECFKAAPVDKAAILNIVQIMTSGCGDEFPDYPLVVRQKFEQKTIFYDNIARAIPTVHAVASIAHFAKSAGILEINGHRGLWAGFLRAFLHVPNARRSPAVDMLAPYQPAVNREPFIAPLALAGDDQFASIEKHYGCILLVVPASADEILFAKKCIAAYTGTRIVYVGEKTDEVYVFLTGVCDPPDTGEIPTWFDCATEIYFFIKKDT